MPSQSRQSDPAATGVSLPVVTPKIRKSKSGRIRALVLLGVHVVIAAHLAHWWASGSTLSPLEPSESMEFAKHRIINAGLILFVLSIASTLVLGRWFCGWGCHLVALQDGSRWILGKLGVRPKPLRAGALMAVPLLAFLYMFIAPFVYQWLGEGRPAHGPTLALSRDDFWATFPPWIPAVIVFVVCGFVIIYLLGSKGFCTFGCPYGGIYGVVDQLSPMRIRVTDDCTGSGHCTAVCSSNVRVHEEVRDFRMVVDPGCMKCLDCVSVCPNDALYFGRGVPAIFAQRHEEPPPKHPRRETTAARSASDQGSTWPRWVLLAVFCVVAVLLFTGYDRDYAWSRNDVLVSGILAAAALAICAALRVRSPRRNDYGVWEDGLLSALFLAALVVFHGLYGMRTFLFALGAAAVAAYMLMQALQLLWRANLSMHGWRLKRHGRLLPAGYGFGIIALALLAFGAHGGLLQYHGFRGKQLERSIVGLRDELAHLRPAAGPEPDPRMADIQSAIRARADQALGHLEFLERWSLIPSADTTLRRAGFHFDAGRTEEYATVLQEGCRRFPESAELRFRLAVHLGMERRPDEALSLFRECIRLDPGHIDAHANLGALLVALGRWDEARQAYESALQANPGSAKLQHAFAGFWVQRGDLDAAAELLGKAVAADADRVERRLAYGDVLARLGRWAPAIEQYETAVKLGPDDVRTHLSLGNACWRAPEPLGDLGRAARHLRRAVELASDSPVAHRMLAEFLSAAGDGEGARRHAQTANDLIRSNRGQGP